MYCIVGTFRELLVKKFSQFGLERAQCGNETCYSENKACTWRHVSARLYEVEALSTTKPEVARAEESTSKFQSYTVESMVRGYHVYRDVWVAALGKRRLADQSWATSTISMPLQLWNGV